MKIKQIIKFPDFNVIVVGTGKNPMLYFIRDDFYYDDTDCEALIKPGLDFNHIEEWFLCMRLNRFKKIFQILER